MSLFRSARRSRVAAALAMAICLASTSMARAETVEQRLEAALIKAMTGDRAAGQRMMPSGAAIRQFIKAGFVRKKPEARADYSDYRLLRKPITFMGHTIIAIEEQYLVEYIGCCVDEGVGVLLDVSGSSDAVKTFGEANGCEVSSDDYDIDTVLQNVGRKRGGKSYLYVYCGMRGLS